MLCEHYHWPPDFWRPMGWREFRAWLRERARSIERRNRGSQTSTDSWSNRASDPWWDEQRKR